MERSSLWEWTLFICCNRPLESEASKLKDDQSYGEIDYAEVGKNNKPITDRNYSDCDYDNNDASQFAYSVTEKYDSNAYDVNELSNLVINNNLEKNNNRNLSLLNMDGLRNQLVRKKSSFGSSSANLRTPFVERCDNFKVTLRGWLYRLEGSALKQWKRRWFVLGDYCLFYYKDTQEEKLLGSVLLPSYIISQCQASEDGITRKFSFKLEHQNMKTYFLAADSKESMNQWIHALSLASIMQFNYSTTFSKNDVSSERNQIDCHDAKANQVRDESRRLLSPNHDTKIENGIDEESGFNSYQSKRAVQQTNLMLNSGDKYPGSYNNVGLPPITYPAYLANFKSADFILPHQKRSHYANAPPKPRRSQANEFPMNLDNTESIYNHPNRTFPNQFPNHPHNNYGQYMISKNPQFNPFMVPNQSTPDLIAHNHSVTSPANLKQPIHSYDQFNQSSNSIPIRPPPPPPPPPFPASMKSCNPLQYSIPPVYSSSSLRFQLNDFNINTNYNQSHLNNRPKPRLPPRPHSADFLERDQEEEEMALIQNDAQPSKLEITNTINGANETNGNGAGNFSRTRIEQELNTNQSRIMQVRPKSSLERYDPYYKLYDEYNQDILYEAKNSQTLASSMMSPPPKPWSDYLRSASNIQPNDEFFNGVTNLPNSNLISNNFVNLKQKMTPLSNLDDSVKLNQAQREESLQRLMEWKQRMMQSPLNKRNLGSIKSQSVFSPIEYGQNGNNNVPLRPPLPKEYRNKMYPLNDQFVDNKSSNVKHMAFIRERSKSFGSSMPANDVSYSSDDEGFRYVMSQTMLTPNLRSIQHLQAPQGVSQCDERRDANSPEYINVQSVRALRQTNGLSFIPVDPAVIRSGGDGQEADEGHHINIKREDYYKASTLLYQHSSRPMQSSPILDLYNQAMDEMKEKLPTLLPSNQVSMSKCEQQEEANPHSLSQSRNVINCKNQPALSLNNKVHSENSSKPVSSKMMSSSTFANSEVAKEENRLSKLELSANKSLNDNHPLSMLEIKKCKNGYKEEQMIEEKLRIEKKLGIERAEDECQEEDVIKKLTKSFEKQKSRPPPNFVKERIQSLEKKGLESNANSFNFWSRPKKDLFNDFKKKIDSSISVLSDSEVFDKYHDNNTDEDNLTTKSAPLTLSPLSSVLADLRKTAELRKERLFNLEKNNKLRKSSFDESFLNRSSFNSSPPKQQVKQNEKGLIEKQDQDKPEGKDVKNDEVSYNNEGEADDEMSRDFDSLQYQNELQKNSLLPQSTKQLLLSEHKSKIRKQFTFDLERKQGDSSEQNAKLSENHSSLDSNCDRSVDQDALHAKYNGNTIDWSHLFKMNKKETRNADLNDQCLQSPTSANILDLIPEDYGIKFLNQERNSLNQDTWNGSEIKIKPSLTSDSLSENYNEESDNVFENSTKKSKSLQDLDNDHLYENIQVFHIYQQTSNGPKLLNPSNTKPKVLDSQLSDSNSRSPQSKSSNKLPSIKEIDSEKIYHDEKACKLIKSSKLEKSNSLNCKKFDSSSMVNLKGSQDISFDQKPKKKESLKNCHSHGDLRATLDSGPSCLTPSPPPPPLPAGYSQPLYLKQTNNSKSTQKYSRSSTDNLHLEPDGFKQKDLSSAGDLMKKSQEELISLLIQLRREQTQVLSNCDKLRSQMELEAKLIEVEPKRRDEHRMRFKEFKEKLCNAERDFENRFQFISMVDDILRMNYINSKSSLEPDNQYSIKNTSGSIDIGTSQAKTASNSLLDKLSESSESSTAFLDKNDQFETPQNSPLKSTSYMPDQVAKEQERLIQILEQDKNILEKTLTGVVTSLSNLSSSEGDQHSNVYSSDVEKMKQQQKVLESELSRVRELLLHSAQKLEERAAENVKFEQDMQLAHSQLTQSLSSGSVTTPQAEGNIILEEQLANIDQAIDDLNAKRQEILENFRKTKDTSLVNSPIGSSELMMPSDKKKSPKSNESLGKNVDMVIYSDDNEVSRAKSVNTRMDQDQINNGIKVNLKSNNSNHVLCNAIQEQNNFQQFPLSFSKTVRLVKRESEKRRFGQLAKLSSSNSTEEDTSEFKLSGNGFNRARSLVRSASSEDVKSLERDWKIGPQANLLNSAYTKNRASPDTVKDEMPDSPHSFEEALFEIGCPKMINIPQRYVPEDSDINLSEEERYKRHKKAQSICKMLTESAYSDYGIVHKTDSSSASRSASLYISEKAVKSYHSRLRKSRSFNDVNKLEASYYSHDAKVIFKEEKKRRAELLKLNSMIAKEIIEKSRLAASSCT